MNRESHSGEIPSVNVCTLHLCLVLVGSEYSVEAFSYLLRKQILRFFVQKLPEFTDAYVGKRK